MADYIDREEMLVQIERREALMVGDKSVSIGAIKEFIKNRPATDVRPMKHGLWITPRNPTKWFCSLCGNAPLYDHDGEYVLSDYCPNCGWPMNNGESNDLLCASLDDDIADESIWRIALEDI